MKIEVKATYLFYLNGNKNKQLEDDFDFIADYYLIYGFKIKDANKSFKFLQKYVNK